MVFPLDKLGSIYIGTKSMGMAFPFLTFELKSMAKFKMWPPYNSWFILDYIPPFNVDTLITCFHHYRSHFPWLLEIAISSNIMWDYPIHSVYVCKFPIFFINNSLAPLLDVHMSYYIWLYSFIIFTSCPYLISMDHPYPLCMSIDDHLCSK